MGSANDAEEACGSVLLSGRVVTDGELGPGWLALFVGVGGTEEDLGASEGDTVAGRSETGGDSIVGDSGSSRSVCFFFLLGFFFFFFLRRAASSSSSTSSIVVL